MVYKINQPTYISGAWVFNPISLWFKIYIFIPIGFMGLTNMYITARWAPHGRYIGSVPAPRMPPGPPGCPA